MDSRFEPPKNFPSEPDMLWCAGRWLVPCLDHLRRQREISVVVRGGRMALYLPDPYVVWLDRRTGDQLAAALIKAGTGTQLNGAA